MTGGMRPALFLDRDGVINVDRDYVHRIADFTFTDGAFALARAATAVGWPVVVVTNQSGIGRGYYDEADFATLTGWMKRRFAEEGAPIAAVYHCPYHPTASLPRYRREHPWRKPGPGMLLAARDDHGLDLGASMLVGDRLSDIAAAEAAGLPVRILIGPGLGEKPGPDTAPEPTHRVASTREAADLVAALLTRRK